MGLQCVPPGLAFHVNTESPHACIALTSPPKPASSEGRVSNTETVYWISNLHSLMTLWGQLNMSGDRNQSNLLRVTHGQWGNQDVWFCSKPLMASELRITTKCPSPTYAAWIEYPPMAQVPWAQQSSACGQVHPQDSNMPGEQWERQEAVLSACLHLHSERGHQNWAEEEGERRENENGVLHFPPQLLHLPPRLSVFPTHSLSISRSHNLRDDNFISFSIWRPV